MIFHISWYISNHVPYLDVILLRWCVFGTLDCLMSMCHSCWWFYWMSTILWSHRSVFAGPEHVDEVSFRLQLQIRQSLPWWMFPCLLINLHFLRRWWYWWSTSHLITACITNKCDIPRFAIFYYMPQYGVRQYYGFYWRFMVFVWRDYCFASEDLTGMCVYCEASNSWREHLVIDRNYVHIKMFSDL